MGAHGSAPRPTGQVAQILLPTLHNLPHCLATILCNMTTVDALDDALLSLLAREPRVGMLEASRRLGVARGTVQARLDKLERQGVVRSFGPELDTAALGYAVSAFATLEIRQGRGHGVVAARLRAIPEVIEAHTITGPGDLLCRLVARSNRDLQRVIDQVVAGDDVLRVSTVIVLATEIAHRTLPLLHAAAGEEA